MAVAASAFNYYNKWMSEWLSFHLYYHEDPGRAVGGFVAPVVGTLLRQGWVDRFFFLRYSLGGPHVRLRLRTSPANQAAVTETTRRSAELFLSRLPSTRALAEDYIRSQNRSILEADAHETDAAAYPDNTLVPYPFRPEVERYGGADLLAPTLDVFTASSLEALQFLWLHRAEPLSRRLVLALRVLLRQALYFAADEEELNSLLAYAVTSWDDSPQSLFEKGDRVFAQQAERFGKILQREVAELAEGCQLGGFSLRAAVQRLSLCLADRQRAVRWQVGGSHLHMTANRLGLSNPEEVYISRLLTASARHFLTSGSDLRRDLQVALAAREPSPLPEALPLLPLEFGDPLP